MDFYTLIDGEQIYAEIVEFENGQLAVYWDIQGIEFNKLLFYNNIQEFRDKFVFGERQLIKDGVKEIEEDN
jgi:hypothetical protein